MPKDPLAREQEMVVQVACHALTRTIQQYSPVGTDTLPIAAVAVSRMFAELISNLSSAVSQTDGTGMPLSLARIASADLVQTNGLALVLCSAR